MRAVVLLAATCIAACSSAPEIRQLTPELPAAFLAAEGETAPDRWWQGLGDPRLDTLVAQALASNLGLAQIEARLRAARANVSSAGAGLFPSLDLRAERSEPIDSGDVSGSASLSLVAGYELDLWGRVRANQRAAGHQAGATRLELEAARISLSADTASLWVRIGSAQQQLALIEAERSNSERVLELVELRFRKGRLNASDVLRQRQLLESTRAQLASTRSELGVLRHALSELLGQPAGTGDWMGYQGSVLLPVPETGIPAQVVHRRPDVQQAWQQLLAADAQLAAAVASRFPQLSLSAQDLTSAAGPVSLFDDWMGSLGASLLGPLIDGGRRRAEVKRSRAVLEQNVAAYRQRVLRAFREIQDLLLQDHHQQQRLASLQSQLALSDASVQRQLQELRGGRIDYPSVLDGQINNSALRRELQRARQQGQEFRIGLYRATAGPIPASAPPSMESRQ